jgi:hypothetical protein
VACGLKAELRIGYGGDTSLRFTKWRNSDELGGIRRSRTGPALLAIFEARMTLDFFSPPHSNARAIRLAQALADNDI